MSIENKVISTIRVLSAEAVERANSGHPGLPLGAAPMGYKLWVEIMNHSPKNPNWHNRDRFVLSAGHGSMLVYSLLHLFDYDMNMEDIKNFRQLDSRTPGHPEYGHTEGIETTTGPLGQGLANAVGMAIAQEHLAEKFNTEKRKIVDHYTYVIVGDGCMMEGITNEASSLAGTLGLSKLIVLYDSNNISIEGDTDLAFREDVLGRYKSLGWDTHFVEDGNDLNAIEDALVKSKENKEKPSFIEIKTKIGYGSPKEGEASAHGEPLGEDNLVKFKENIGWEYDGNFYVPTEVKEYMASVIDRKEEEEEEWNKEFKLYREENPKLAEEFDRYMSGDIGEKDLDIGDLYKFEKDMATRKSSEVVLNKLCKNIPMLFGGSADLAPSNKTIMKERDHFSKENRMGSNMHFGVREHAMAAISSGIALHGGLIPYCASFLIFTDYLKPALRLSALMEQRVIYVMTHDSIGVGEDGPTHEPIEQLSMLRATPNVTVFRPADGKETAAAWESALLRKSGPTVIALTRQGVPNLEKTSSEAKKGAYILKELGKDIDIVLMGSGSEVQLIVGAADRLYQDGYGVRVVSVPSMEAFEDQGQDYKNKLLPSHIKKRVSVEAGARMPWYRYIGTEGLAIGIDHYGASAPGGELFERFGFTEESIYQDIKVYLEK